MHHRQSSIRSARRGAALGLAAALAAGLVVAPAPAVIAQPAGAPVSFADLADQLSPAVVNISTTSRITAPERGTGPRLPEGSPFRDLFPDLFDGEPGRRGPVRPRSSLGSGFVISPDGYIVTNNHVIEGADEIRANFPNGRSLDAQLVGSDPKTDIAVLKVTSDEPLPYVMFGDSRESRVGDWVIAIGNPFGLGGSVSAGIISARNRDIRAGPYDDFLQTDAAINRGNSGGPLFNMAGEVVGVNTAIISPTGGSIGIGFAVPSALASNIVDQLREFGVTRRGWLGVQIQQVTPEIAESLGLDEERGALVTSLIPEGPAQAAGIVSGDVILSFDGRRIEEMRDLPRIVAEAEAGKDVAVEVWRGGETVGLTVELGLLEEEAAVLPASAERPGAAPSGAQATVLGMTLRSLSPALREMHGIEADLEGVIVDEVDADGPAAMRGLRPGDVILEVAQETVSTPAEVTEKVAAARETGRRSVLLLVSSGGDLRFVAVSVEQ